METDLLESIQTGPHRMANAVPEGAQGLRTPREQGALPRDRELKSTEVSRLPRDSRSDDPAKAWAQERRWCGFKWGCGTGGAGLQGRGGVLRTEAGRGGGQLGARSTPGKEGWLVLQAVGNHGTRWAGEW